MANGLLQVMGTIDVGQFWPTGSADADTTKILVDTTPGGFQFRPAAGQPFATTQAFSNATVVGKIRKSAIDSQGRITVRLQGIDAPELHYRPSALLKPKDRTDQQHELYLERNEEYRQLLAETATLSLTELLQSAGQDPLPCRVISAVDEPNEVFDTYGRFIGDILVAVTGQEINVNTWLARNGWAFPAFYNSMSEEEILTLWNASDLAWQEGVGVWPHLPDNVGNLDWDLIYRRPSTNPVPDPMADSGDTIIPKIFRRLSTWAVNRYAKMATGSFHKYLGEHPDHCLLTEEFLEQGEASTIHQLDEFVHADGFVELWPEQIVFREAPSRLIGPGGADVTW
jgi:endonuclease YncB( thermonuclease family)